MYAAYTGVPVRDQHRDIWDDMVLAASQSGRYTIDGDSGGPWFSLNGCRTYVWAKGIHHGLTSIGSTTFEVFTPLTTLSGGLTVNTGRGVEAVAPPAGGATAITGATWVIQQRAKGGRSFRARLPAQGARRGPPCQ